MKLKLWIISIFLLTNTAFPQNMWLWNQRTHPELKWQTMETEHFNIHFHQGIEDIALRGAQIAEQAYQPILDQLALDDFGKTDIVFSAEDEIMNGFAMPSNQIFIWVSQNDVAGNFGGSKKWLELVVTHEFQHVAQFQAQRTWAGIFGAVSIPAWWLEGMAEYLTEVWRVGRSDSRMKVHTYRNTMDQLDAHDDGYAKVLYLAWKHGDSSLVKISNHRLYLNNEKKKFPYWYDFTTAFEASTGQTLKSFNEEWRRVMNTYYYGYKAQKETMEEVGEPLLLGGFSRVQSASLSPDSAQVAVVGRKEAGMRDYSLYTVATDSTKKIVELAYGRFRGGPAWGPETKQVIISEYHRGSYGSLINDLRLFNVTTKKSRWITKDKRALHPIFSLDGKGIFFVAHPGETSQIYYQDLATNKQVMISKFTGDIQVQSLNLSPSGDRLAFMIQETSGDVNIAIMDRDGHGFQKVTDDPEEDMLPVWTEDGEAIIYTSYRNSTPNLYRVDLEDLKITQMTDVAEGIYSRQRLPGGNKIIASTLPDVDSVRIRIVEVDRVAPKLELNLRDAFTGWREKAPDIQLPQTNYDQVLKNSTHPYRPLKSIRPLTQFIWPLDGSLALFGVYSDALGKHLIQGGLLATLGESFYGGYFSYINLQFLPKLNFYGIKNITMHFQRSADHAFSENRNGLGVAFEVPMNSGNSLSSNHLIRGKLFGVNRDIIKLDEYTNSETGEVLSTPFSTELKAGLSYVWKSQRPHKDKNVIPRHGHGILAHIEKTLPSIWGENDYTQYWLEGFFNYKIPKLPMIFYSRLKYIGQSGSIIVQDELGFSEESPIYFSTEYMKTIRSVGIFDAPESYNLRGQEGSYPGDHLLFSSTELRLPLISKIPVEFFGLGAQSFSGVVFYDFGYLPQTSTHLSTWGGEIRFDLSLYKFPLMTLALGQGGNSEFWSGSSEFHKNDDFWSKTYFRMALVNPF